MPTEDEVTRKLRAILSADVKGYSLLMADDETLTVKTLKSYRKVMSAQIGRHKGRVVDAPGDNLLAEFASVVDGVQCAVEIQKILKEKNEDLPPDKRLEFRIGVNIGDVIQDGDNIYGAGVNVAARIEGLADAGGICISRNAYDHVKDKLNYGYEYLGEHEVKNIKGPVRVYKVLMRAEDAGKLIGENLQRYRKKWPWLAVVTVAFLIGVIVWQFYYEKLPPIEAASVENMAFPLPEKPSIAVLPFQNLNDDSAQDYIGDGITKNIISALSNISDMFVISRDSTSTYKGKPVKIKQVSEELGVRYVLEGSAQKSGNRVRINAQLIDATTGHYLWSEKYDRELQDLFALQDEITHNIIVELQVKLTEGEQARVSQKSTTSLEAWSYANKGLAFWLRTSPENNAKAMELFEKAVELDPNYVWAWVRLAWTHVMAANPEWSQNPSEHLKMFFEISKKVSAIDESDSDVHALAGLAYLWQGELEKAIAEGEKSIIFGPTNAQSHVLLAVSMNTAGRFDDIIRLVKKAMRLHPYYPAYYLTWLGGAYRMEGRYEDALTVYNQLLDRCLKGEYPVLGAHVYLADLYAEIGKEDEARAHAAEIFKIEPEFSLERVNSINTYDYTDPVLMERRLKALRKAGIPESPHGKEPQKRPSIAVLPFDNLSDDPEQGYLADGLTDELIGDLSKIDGVLVISRNSTFTYKGKHIKIPEVAKELNVRYVLEGSVQRAGDRLRVRAQLIDGNTDHHVWSESYDGNGTMDNIFEFQDEITGKIVAALAVKLTEDEKNRISDKGTNNIMAYEAFLKGIDYFYKMAPDDFIESVRYFEMAINIDPNYSRAYASLGRTYLWSWYFGFRPFWKKLEIDANTALIKSAHYLKVAMKKPNYVAYILAAGVELRLRHYEKMIYYAKKAISIAPNDPDANLQLGWMLVHAGDSEEAINYLNKAIRLDPKYIHTLTNAMIYKGVAHFTMGQYEQAVKYINKGEENNPTFYYHNSVLAASYAHLGRITEAKKSLQTYLESFQKGYSPSIQRLYFEWPFQNVEVFDRLAEGLVIAGLPGEPKEYYKVLEGNKLTGDEIKKLLFGNLASGIMPWGKWHEEYHEDGNIYLTAIGANQAWVFKDKGKTWIEGDMRCWHYEKSNEGLVNCSEYYRNPDGNAEKKSEYLSIDYAELYPISVVE